ncbi:IclR family transcriptional regulator [Nocardioides sp. Root190]|uniref:IclR family transcriptional regulator domain-containing protein n=1 Tax=Nocardioides sp. Root190 TaxID=1736488 RepID=UPI0006F845A9|nr:IclR family transcriptional regulator C-terminal domain-containing protein [Nocardioides sp. Root190]KRB75105.1 IclR family transcriptional regulator [Nocardioides sp. Root190]
MSAAPGVGNDRDFIQSIERGFAVLLAFDADLPTPTLAELATRTGFSRPAVRRILLTLQKLGYVASQGSRWSLTPRVLTIGQHYAATHGIVEVAQPHLMRIAERTGESASLAQLDGSDVVYVARVHVRRVLSLNVDVGTRLPVHATSMGRVLAAYADSAIVDRIVDAGLPRLTEWTVTDPVEFRDRLHDVRRAGYAIVDSELEDGFLSAAVPVRDAIGDVVAALAYSTARGRQSVRDLEATVIPVLLEVAGDIASDLSTLPARSQRLRIEGRDGFF